MKAGQLVVDNDPGSLRQLESWMREQARDMQIPESIAAELRVALYELLANTIMHGFEPGEPRQIEVSASRDGGLVRFTLIDDARPFDPTSASTPAPLDDIAQAPIGGLGLKLVRSYSDSLSYERRDGRNCLILTRAVA